jgi:hypothetical protein
VKVFRGSAIGHGSPARFSSQGSRTKSSRLMRSRKALHQPSFSSPLDTKHSCHARPFTPFASEPSKPGSGGRRPAPVSVTPSQSAACSATAMSGKSPLASDAMTCHWSSSCSIRLTHGFFRTATRRARPTDAFLNSDFREFACHSVPTHH